MKFFYFYVVAACSVVSLVKSADPTSDTGASTFKIEAANDDVTTGSDATTTTMLSILALHPHDLILVHREKHVLGLEWRKPEQYKDEPLTFDVFYVKGEKDSCPETLHTLGSTSVETKETSVKLTGLDKASFYSICVRTTLPGKIGSVFSRVLAVSTDGYGGDGSPCRCETANVADKQRPCDETTGDCYCRAGAKQPRCKECETNYYLERTSRECLPCNCDTDRSTGSCSTSGRGVVECHCKGDYAGRKCESCKQGFYLKQRRCLPCHCSGNSKPNVTDVCDPFSGVCKTCWFNTTGDDCEMCADGFEGDAEQRTCRPLRPAPRDVTRSHIVFVVLACLLLGVFLCAITLAYIFHELRDQRLMFGVFEPRKDVKFSQMLDSEWDEAGAMQPGSQQTLSAQHLQEVAASLDADPLTSSSDQRLLLDINDSRPIYRSIKS